jgi:hypothetical protein
MREEEKKECCLVSFAQEFQLTLTAGVNQTPNVHPGLGPLGVEILEKKFPKIEQAELSERQKEKVISGIRMAQ